MNFTETELVKRAIKGSRQAFEALFLLEKDYMYKLAFMYMKNRDDAMDLVQNCILKCMISIEDLKEPKFFRTWMTKIMMNCAKTEWGKRGRYDLLEGEDVFINEDREITSEEMLDLYRAIDYLGYPYRDIIIHHYFVGAKLAEIAQMLDMPVGTVKVYHSKAKKRLKEMLEVEIV